MKKIFFSVAILVASFSIAVASCGYGFLTSCGPSYYMEGPCNLSDDTVVAIMDLLEDANC